MSTQPHLIIVLAAGKGVRMRSDLPKVLHRIGGRSMLAHVLATALEAGASRLALVVAPGMEAVRAEAKAVAPDIEVFEQANQAGTADAVLAARPAIESHKGDVTVLFADTPLVEVATLRKLTAALQAGAGIAALGFEPADATGYGRLIVDGEGRVTAIREHNDASEVERRIRLCNAGAMAFRIPDLAGLLSRIGNANAKSESSDRRDRARCHGRTRHAARRVLRGGGDGRQLARAAGGRRGGVPAPRALARHAGGRHADRAGYGVVQLRHDRSAVT